MLRRILLGALATAIIAVAAIRGVRTASNERAWVAPQQRLPMVTVRGDLVEIRNVRDFTWRTDDDFDVRYAGRTYDLRKLDSAWYVVSRFGSVPGLAHAFLTFGFEGDYVAVSVEARKERGETYSPFQGLLNAYELMYVAGTERDLVGLRTHVWKEEVTLYPIRADIRKLRAVFLDMVLRADALSRRPESYDTLLNSCNSNIVRHVNAISPGRIGFDVRTILPGFSDRVAWELGLIDSSRPLEEVRRAYRIEEAARRYPLDEHFSENIRRHLPR